MDILFIGHTLTAKGLRTAFEEENIKITSNPDLPLVPELVAQNGFDLVIVESSMPGAGDICDKIFDLTIVPVILLVNESETSWKTISTFDVDGFITKNASDTEVLARIKAIYRRSKRAEKLRR